MLEKKKHPLCSQKLIAGILLNCDLQLGLQK